MARLDPQYVIASLVQRGVPEHVARGVVMNFQDESGLDSGIQEGSSNVHGTRGFGLAQWTDTSFGVGRRTNLENFARAQGRAADDPEVQLDFFMAENAGPEAGAWSQVMAAPTAQDAAVAFVNKWERPAKEHAASRSAKYMNQSDSPSEGGARFGGTGLGDPAATPAAPAVAAAPTSPYALPKTNKADPYAKAAAGAFGGMAAMQAPTLGAGGAAPQLPMQVPVAMPSTPIVSGGGNDAEGRNALAMLLARLNKNTLVG